MSRNLNEARRDIDSLTEQLSLKAKLNESSQRGILFLWLLEGTIL